MSSTDPRTPGRSDQLLFGALAALCASVVLQLVDKQPKLDSFLGWSLYCLAAALPFLVASFLLEEYRPQEGRKTASRLLFDLAGITLALVGILLLFFFLNLASGGIFAGASLFCFLYVLRSLR